MYTALLLWCFVKLTQFKPSRLDPGRVGTEEHVSARLSSIASVGTPWPLVGRCNRTLVTAVSTLVSSIKRSTQSWEFPKTRSNREGSLAVDRDGRRCPDGTKIGSKGKVPSCSVWTSGPSGCGLVTLAVGHSRRGLGGFICIAACTGLGPNLIPDPYVLVVSVDILGSTSARSSSLPV